jgi:hypothetical protein
LIQPVQKKPGMPKNSSFLAKSLCDRADTLACSVE